MKVFLETYGCQMNESDSEVLRSILHKANYQFVHDLSEADIVLLNTCAVRENAHQKIYRRLSDFKKLRQENKLKAVGVLGCMSQTLRRELTIEAPIVDIVAGPDSYKRLPDLLEKVIGGKEKGFDFSLSEYETYSDIAPVRMEGINAWISIMRGCDNFCTFCVVPYTRGRERSRTIASIVAEARQIVDQGYPQITLLGQNVNSYKGEDGDFADLMEQMAQVENLKRVRFTSPHPKDFSRKLLKIMAEYHSLCKHIHLPLQSGSDSILERMNRTYTQREFLELVQEIREILPGVSLTTDIICGFCGETEEDFEQTRKVVEEVGFDSAFIFKYSERNNTIAARKFADDVAEEDKLTRVTSLNQLQRKISQERNAAEVGKIFEVLIEHSSKKNAEEWFGRSDHNKGVVFASAANKPGDIVSVKITDYGTNTLLGKIQ